MFISLFNGAITANTTGRDSGTATANGVFAGVPTTLTLAWSGGKPSLTGVTASDVDLRPAVGTLFSGVPAPRVVTDSLALRLTTLSARFVDREWSGRR